MRPSEKVVNAADPESSGGDETIEIVGDLSRRRAEALVLEIRRLAKSHGVEVRCRIAGVTTTDAPRALAE
jgi:putative aminopeptidase FrvX